MNTILVANKKGNIGILARNSSLSKKWFINSNNLKLVNISEILGENIKERIKIEMKWKKNYAFKPTGKKYVGW